MVCKIRGRRIYLWRAVDDEGEVLDLVMPRKRDTEAALKLLGRRLRNQPVDPERITTDGLASYPAAFRRLASNTFTNQANCERTIGRKFPSTDPKAGAKTAGVQVPALRPTLPHNPRRDLQYLLHSAPSDPPINASGIP
jgi:hypothetical protein